MKTLDLDREIRFIQLVNSQQSMLGINNNSLRYAGCYQLGDCIVDKFTAFRKGKRLIGVLYPWNGEPYDPFESELFDTMRGLKFSHSIAIVDDDDIKLLSFFEEF